MVDHYRSRLRLPLFHWLADLLQRKRPELSRLKPVEVIETFRETTKLEMDLRLEAAAAEEIGKNFGGKLLMDLEQLVTVYYQLVRGDVFL